MKPFGIRGIDFLGDAGTVTSRSTSRSARRRRTRPSGSSTLPGWSIRRPTRSSEADRLVSRRRRLPAVPGRQCPDRESGELLRPGHNYHLVLDPGTKKFVFIPGDLEFSLANFLLMGSADQLMDLSLVKPYPGENKLPDRLLAITEVSEKYQKLLKELAANSVHEGEAPRADRRDRIGHARDSRERG